MIYFKMSFLKR